MASKKQIRANRENGLKGGVKTPEGKARSRLNARQHGIFVSALTDEDHEDLYVIEDRLIASLQPVGVVEEMLVEKLALTYLRLQRCARAEAEYHIRTWQEPDIIDSYYDWEKLKVKRERGVRAVPFRSSEFTRIVELVGLYDVRLTNQFLRLLHEIERRQRLRAGENVPPPIVADLTIQADSAPSAQETVPFEVSAEARPSPAGPEAAADACKDTPGPAERAAIVRQDSTIGGDIAAPDQSAAAAPVAPGGVSEPDHDASGT